MKFKEFSELKGMKINPNKTRAMVLFNKDKCNKYNKYIESKIFVDSMTFLGIKLDTNLSFNSHVNGIIYKINQSIEWIKLYKYNINNMNYKELRCIFNNHCLSFIRYGIGLWGHTVKNKSTNNNGEIKQNSMLYRLNVVVNKFIRIFF